MIIYISIYVQTIAIFSIIKKYNKTKLPLLKTDSNIIELSGFQLIDILNYQHLRIIIIEFLNVDHIIVWFGSIVFC